MHKNILEAFTKRYRPIPTKNVLRKVGVEFELPVVRDNGEAVSYETIRRMFTWLEDRGWDLEKDSATGENVVAKKSIGDGRGRFGYEQDVIGTDVGFCTVETSLSPEDNLFALEDSWAKIKSTLIEFFSQENCHILGYGVQPITHPAHDLIANKERYAIFEQESSNHFIDKRYGTDLSAFATSASTQCHIDVYKEEAITAVNVLNGLAPLFSAVTANAPIWRGSIDPEWVDIREIFWDKCWSDRIEQVGIPDKFQNFSDYLERLRQFQPLMVKRGNQFIKILGCKTFGEYLERTGPQGGLTAGGDKFSLQSRPEDILFHSGFAWWQARLAPAYGTVEMRPCSQQPANAMLAVSAFTLGLVENLSEAEELYNEYTLTDWRVLRLAALRNGMQAKIRDTPVAPIVDKALQVARRGLHRRQLGEEIYLDVLDQRAASGCTIADELKVVFDKKDLKKFFDLVEINVGASEAQMTGLSTGSST